VRSLLSAKKQQQCDTTENSTVSENPGCNFLGYYALGFHVPFRELASMKNTFSVSISAIGASLAIGLFSAPSAQAASISHLYELNNSLADSKGGQSLVSNGGTVSASGYAFDADEGPSLSNSVNSTNYSILMDFSLSQLDGYRKIIDFKDRTSDNGLYNYEKQLSFYPGTTGGNSFTVDTPVRLILTRNSSTSTVAGYVNGMLKMSFTDLSNLATFSEPNSIMHFFRDDTARSGEASGGLLTKLAIYDGALSAQDASDLGGAGSPIVPATVPTPALVPGLIGLGLGILKKRKSEVVEA
jgi:hypothetical protein